MLIKMAVIYKNSRVFIICYIDLLCFLPKNGATIAQLNRAELHYQT